MDVREQFEKQLIFDYIVNQVQHKRTKFSETGMVYIESAMDFFDNVARGLESIIILKKEYFLVENLQNIYEAIGKNTTFSKKGIENAIHKIDRIKKQLDNLSKNPDEFYQSKDSSELLNICRKICYLYY